MPEEMTLAEMLETFGFDWMDRTILANTLKAFGVKPSGKRINPKGGRPAILYPTDRVTAMVDVIMTFRERK